MSKPYEPGQAPLSESAGYGYEMLVPHSEGIKHDADKPRMDLLPPEMLEAVAKVLGFGAAKYGDAYNWRKGMAWGRYYAAALRHMNAWNRGQDLDDESGLPHLAHAACCLAFLIASQESGHGTDDRFNRFGPSPLLSVAEVLTRSASLKSVDEGGPRCSICHECKPGWPDGWRNIQGGGRLLYACGDCAASSPEKGST